MDLPGSCLGDHQQVPGDVSSGSVADLPVPLAEAPRLAVASGEPVAASLGPAVVSHGLVAGFPGLVASSPGLVAGLPGPVAGVPPLRSSSSGLVAGVQWSDVILPGPVAQVSDDFVVPPGAPFLRSYSLRLRAPVVTLHAPTFATSTRVPKEVITQEDDIWPDSEVDLMSLADEFMSARDPDGFFNLGEVYLPSLVSPWITLI